MLHYILIFVIITIIVICQFYRFTNTKRKLKVFVSIFPKSDSYLELGSCPSGEPQIRNSSDNPVWETIRDSINNYLKNNKGAASDYHLIKDIVERNCEAKEDEIDTQIPVPLYLGLVGTMVGILVGVGTLVFSGGLSNLLGIEPGGFVKFIIKLLKINSNHDGVEMLLGGVAIAMLSSIVGIVLTTVGAASARECRVEVERNKNTFLSWIQASLLPRLNNNAAAALEKVSYNLTQFNNAFSENTHELKESFSILRDTYKDLLLALEAINNLKIKDLAKYNIQVYENMKSTTHEISAMGVQLKGVNQYLSATNDVVEKLDLVFEREIRQFDERINAIKKTVGTIDNGISQSLARLNENTAFHLDEFIRSSVNLNGKFDKVVEDQQKTLEDAVVRQNLLFEEGLTKQEVNFSNILDRQNKALEAKSKEIEVIVAELQNLAAVKVSMGNLERATKEQNCKIDQLTQSIEKFAQLKMSESREINSKTLFPKWLKVASLVIGGSIAITGLFFVVIMILSLAGIIY